MSSLGHLLGHSGKPGLREAWTPGSLDQQDHGSLDQQDHGSLDQLVTVQEEQVAVQEEQVTVGWCREEGVHQDGTGPGYIHHPGYTSSYTRRQ